MKRESGGSLRIQDLRRVDRVSELPLESVERGHLPKVLEEARWTSGGKTGAAALLGSTPAPSVFACTSWG
ncbi:transcriptional regulator, Fis family [Methylocaldum marinum]|uniref:Transcriptional regulator, Fis family n=1 Tax=Methylocaldum marinum TaxID=1432792 RepID=A0A250KTY3_9GAMM|nr:hypothetical protein [Methylocaldum marinum]BBA34964.1 transcriptional regulator, Fis family [Methylocaldum marinum]